MNIIDIRFPVAHFLKERIMVGGKGGAELTNLLRGMTREERLWALYIVAKEISRRVRLGLMKSYREQKVLRCKARHRIKQARKPKGSLT